MSLAVQMARFVENTTGDRISDFWQRFRQVEDGLRGLLPFVPFKPGTSPKRLQLMWTGTHIEPIMGLDLPVPRLAELHEALDRLLDVAKVVSALPEQPLAAEPRLHPSDPKRVSIVPLADDGGA
jgi:hypothetical protein